MRRLESVILSAEKAERNPRYTADVSMSAC